MKDATSLGRKKSTIEYSYRSTLQGLASKDCRQGLQYKGQEIFRRETPIYSTKPFDFRESVLTITSLEEFADKTKSPHVILLRLLFRSVLKAGTPFPFEFAGNSLICDVCSCQWR
jgi:hypothetical protein